MPVFFASARKVQKLARWRGERCESWTQTCASRRNLTALPGPSGSNVEALVHEFDRADVVAAIPQHSPEIVVEGVDSQRRRPPVSVMIHPSSKAISVMKPSVLRLAVFASRTLSDWSSENVSAARSS